uniref:Uncharacterized protein n=1 Tax=Ixodes ricinus TaxID=34613 RepID=A0A6B0UYZ1_IXORI
MFSAMAPLVTLAHGSVSFPAAMSLRSATIPCASFRDTEPLSHQRAPRGSLGWIEVARVVAAPRPPLALACTVRALATHANKTSSSPARCMSSGDAPVPPSSVAPAVSPSGVAGGTPYSLGGSPGTPKMVASTGGGTSGRMRLSRALTCLCTRAEPVCSRLKMSRSSPAC